MGYLVFAAVLAAVAYLVFGRKSEPQAKPPDKAPAAVPKPLELSTATGPARDPVEYVKARWTEAEQEKASGAASTFPSWFFDPVTTRQLDRLKQDGTSVSGGQITKGAASDLIGLKEPVEEDDAEVLKFFKVPLKGMSQTLGRYEVKRLMASEENRAAWEARPASPMQKEYLKFFGIAVPKGLTTVEAFKLIADHRKESRGQDDKKAAEWETFETIVTDLQDAETREDYDIKKPTLSAIKEAIAAVRERGEDADDLQLVVDQLIETNPDLSR